jgi:hypothetical protein
MLGSPKILLLVAVVATLGAAQFIGKTSHTAAQQGPAKPAAAPAKKSPLDKGDFRVGFSPQVVVL